MKTGKHLKMAYCDLFKNIYECKFLALFDCHASRLRV